MSALAEALVAAQRRAISALEKAYVAGSIDGADLTSTLSAIGATDAVDQAHLVQALSIIREHGAQLPAEGKPSTNGAPEAKATEPQLARIRRDLAARGFPLYEEADARTLTKSQASEIIDTLAAGTYEPGKWDPPF